MMAPKRAPSNAAPPAARKRRTEEKEKKEKEKNEKEEEKEEDSSDDDDEEEEERQRRAAIRAGKKRADPEDEVEEGASSRAPPTRSQPGTVAGAPPPPPPPASTAPAAHENDDECSICGKQGELLCCDGCPRAFHFACAGVPPELAEQEAWYCSRCVRERRQRERAAIAQQAAAATAATATAAATPGVPARSASAPADGDRVRVMGPTSALTSFLAEKGISARRIREQHLAAAAAEGGGSEPSGSTAAAVEAAPERTRVVYDLSAHAPSRARLRFEVVTEPTTEAAFEAARRRRRARRRATGLDKRGAEKDPAPAGKSTPGKKGGAPKKIPTPDTKKGASQKTKKVSKGATPGKKGAGAAKTRRLGAPGGGGDSSDDDDSDSDDDDDDDSDFAVDDTSSAAASDEEEEEDDSRFSGDEGVDGILEWLHDADGAPIVRRRVAVCGLCDKQLPPGVLRCPACASRTLESTVAAGGRKRTGRAEGSLIDSLLGRVRPLQELCIRMLCDNLDVVESFGDVGDLVREGICRTVCRMRRLNNDTLRLFLDSAARRLVLFDCAGLSPDAYRLMPPKAGALTILELGGCGRLHDEHLLAIVHAAPHLRVLALGGPFLLTDHALQLAIRQAHHPLQRFSVTYCPRLGTGTLRALGDRCHATLEALKLVGCESIRDADLAPLHGLAHLAKLHIRECPQLTDAGILPLLTAIGRGLTSLKLDGCTGLSAAETGRTSELAGHTLPVAVAARGAAMGPGVVDRVFAQLGPALCPGTRLVRFNGAGTAFDDAALVALVDACPALERLDLTRTLVTNDGVAALVAAPCIGRLTHLSLNRIAGDVTLETLLALAAVAASLRRADLSWMRVVDDDVVAALRTGGVLEYLAVWGCNRLTEQALALAQRAPACTIVGAFFAR